MRGKEELQVRNVFLKDLKLWLIASIQSAPFTSDSFPQSPTMQTDSGGFAGIVCIPLSHPLPLPCRPSLQPCLPHSQAVAMGRTQNEMLRAAG